MAKKQTAKQYQSYWNLNTPYVNRLIEKVQEEAKEENEKALQMQALQHDKEKREFCEIILENCPANKNGVCKSSTLRYSPCSIINCKFKQLLTKHKE